MATSVGDEERDRREPGVRACQQGRDRWLERLLLSSRLVSISYVSMIGFLLFVA